MLLFADTIAVPTPSMWERVITVFLDQGITGVMLLVVLYFLRTKVEDLIRSNNHVCALILIFIGSRENLSTPLKFELSTIENGVEALKKKYPPKT